MQKRVVGLPFHQFPEVGKLIKARRLRPSGMSIKIHNKKNKVLTRHEQACCLTAGISLFSSQQTESGTGSI